MVIMKVVDAQVIKPGGTSGLLRTAAPLDHGHLESFQVADAQNIDPDGIDELPDALLDGGNLKSSQVSAACFDAADWHKQFRSRKAWRKYSQGNQDSVLDSLFNKLGTLNQFYVEFGFSQWSWWDIFSAAAPNTRYLAEQGWKGLLMDSSHFNPFENLHMEFITPENVVDLFRKYSVPQEPDYVSIDMDSCDLWVFLNLTKHYRPRVLTVEYNSNYKFPESRTNVCVNGAGDRYSWHRDNMYGASLAALHKAAHARGYAVVYVEPRLDVFLVRKDLICKNSRVKLSHFEKSTGIKMWKQASAKEKAIWTQEY